MLASDFAKFFCCKNMMCRYLLLFFVILFLSACAGRNEDASRLRLFADGVSMFEAGVQSNLDLMLELDNERRNSLAGLYFVRYEDVPLRNFRPWLNDFELDKWLEFLRGTVDYTDAVAVSEAEYASKLSAGLRVFGRLVNGLGRLSGYAGGLVVGEFYSSALDKGVAVVDEVARSRYRREELLPLMAAEHAGIARGLRKLRRDIVGPEGSFATLLGDMVASIEANEKRLLLVVKRDGSADSLSLYRHTLVHLRASERRSQLVRLWDDLPRLVDALVAAHAELSGVAEYSGAERDFHRMAMRFYQASMRWSDYGG